MAPWTATGAVEPASNRMIAMRLRILSLYYPVLKKERPGRLAPVRPPDYTVGTVARVCRPWRRYFNGQTSDRYFQFTK